MNKGELIENMAKSAGITKNQATEALNCFCDCVEKTLKKDERLTLVGFGTFSVTKRNARQGRNPRTGEVINIPAKRVVKFKAGKDLSENV